MAERKEIVFSANDTFDGAKIEVVGGIAKLINVPPYATGDPTIITEKSYNVKTLEGFFENSTKPTGSEIKYTFLAGTQDKYWDGNDWVNSDGTYNQSNLATEIDDNRITAIFNSDVQIKAFLHSDDGTQTPILTNITLLYTPTAQTSASYDFNLTRNRIIELAYENIGVKSSTQALTPEQYTRGSDLLNAMVKNWAAEEIYIWNQKWITIPLAVSDIRLVGSTSYICIRNHTASLRNKPGSGDEWKSYWEEASETATINWAIEINYHSINNYNLDTNVIDIEVSRIKQSSGGYTILHPIARDDYFSLGSPLIGGEPTRYFFNKKLQSEMFLYPAPENATDYTIEMFVYTYPEDYDTGSNYSDLLQEWLEPLIFGLSVRLAPQAGIFEAQLKDLKDLAKEAKEIARKSDHEFGDLQVQPDLKGVTNYGGR